MRLKLDENLGNRGAEQFRNAGHDVETVASQNLCSALDVELIEWCRVERRCLVTLDLDFGNPLVFPPDQYSGIAVLRLPRKPGPTDVYRAAATLLAAIRGGSIEGQLWIVQLGRVRVYQQERGDDS